MKKAIILIICTICFASVSCKKNKKEDPITPLAITFESTAVSVNNDSDGTITLTVTGGKQPYTFNWSNGSTTKDLTDLAAGTYTVTVTDASNQSANATITVSKIEPLFSDQGTVTDIDGNVYKTIKIGDQWWMAENLKVTHSSNGQPVVSYIYNNNSSYVTIYGRLYDWNAAMNGSTQEGAQGIAPNGWHIPSDAEWQKLFDYLGGISVAGAKMKATGTQYWNAPNSNATNVSGFTSLPAGGGYPLDFEGMGDGTHYWSSSSHGSNIAVPTVHSGTDILLPQIPKTFTVSIRCIKD